MGPAACPRAVSCCHHASSPFRSQSCPRTHSCSSSALPSTLATGQFPTGPPPSGPCSCCLLRAGTTSEPGGGSASCEVHVGGWVGPGPQFLRPYKGGEGPGWGLGPELWDVRRCALVGACPHKSLTPRPCPSLGDGGGQGPRAHQVPLGYRNPFPDLWGRPDGEIEAPSRGPVRVLNEGRKEGRKSRGGGLGALQHRWGSAPQRCPLEPWGALPPLPLTWPAQL